MIFIVSLMKLLAPKHDSDRVPSTMEVLRRKLTAAALMLPTDVHELF